MSDFSLIGGGAECVEEAFDYSSTVPTTITANATTNTVGSYVELLSAANNDKPVTAIWVNIVPNSSGSQGDIMINIALGAASSEVDIIENIWVPASSTSNAALYQFMVPISISSGQRISANCQSSISSNTTSVHLQLIRGDLNNNPLGAVDTIGANTGTTDGTTVNAAGTINTFGSWTQLTASTSQPYRGFIVCAHKLNGSMTDMRETYDIGIGSATNEEIIYSGQYVRPDGSERVHGTISPFIPVQIPSGSRIAARVQADSTNADANLDFIIYGVR